VVIHLGIDSPDVFSRSDAIDDVFNRHHRCQHRMILIVVLVHPIAPDQVKICELIEEIADYVEPIVGSEVRGIRFRNANDMVVFDVLRIKDANFRGLVDRKLGHLLIRELPDWICLVAEILQADPDLASVGHEPRTPIIENLQAPDLAHRVPEHKSNYP
jgi:hypothetical protein